MHWTSNGLNLEWTQPRMDWTPNELNPNVLNPNVLNHKWTKLRMDWTQNGLNPEWTQPRLDSTPTGLNPLSPDRESTPNGLIPDWDSTPNGLNPDRDSTPTGQNSEWDSTSNYSQPWMVYSVKVYIKRMDLKGEYISVFQSKKVFRASTYEFSSMLKKLETSCCSCSSRTILFCFLLFLASVPRFPFYVESHSKFSPFCVESHSVLSPFRVESHSVLSLF
jgi:hypothetical protein